MNSTDSRSEARSFTKIGPGAPSGRQGTTDHHQSDGTLHVSGKFCRPRPPPLCAQSHRRWTRLRHLSHRLCYSRRSPPPSTTASSDKSAMAAGPGAGTGDSAARTRPMGPNYTNTPFEPGLQHDSSAARPSCCHPTQLRQRHPVPCTSLLRMKTPGRRPLISMRTGGGDGGRVGANESSGTPRPMPRNVQNQAPTGLPLAFHWPSTGLPL